MKRTRDDILTDPSVHTLTKNVLIEAAGQDPVDAYHDVSLALEVLKDELDALLVDFEKDMTSDKPILDIPELPETDFNKFPETGLPVGEHPDSTWGKGEDTAALCIKYGGDCDMCSQEPETHCGR